MLHLLNNFRCNLKIGSIIRSSEIRRSDPLPYLGKGQNYENYNVENQKEHQKIWRWSLHRNVSFSWSLLQHHYYDKKKTFDVVILPMASKKITMLKIKNVFLSNYLWHITYGYQGLWGPGGVWLGSIRLC
jgi:hypothetical protein